MNISHAYFIKLGEAGCWEQDSLQSNKVRFGWKYISVTDIINRKWNLIKTQIDNDFISRGKKTGSTNDFNALKNICESDGDTIFITFISGMMYWCTIIPGSIGEDPISKYIETNITWTNHNISGKRDFFINNLSGRLTKLQLFMGTLCTVGNELKEFDYLCNLINGLESQEYTNLLKAMENLKVEIKPAIKSLSPKDFEIFIDLLFRNIGWRRTSVLGEVMKFFDLILEEPLPKSIHGVQIKSRSTLTEYNKYRSTFLNQYSTSINTFYYFVHSPDKNLADYIETNDQIKIMKADDICEMAIESGLVYWLLDKAK